MSNTCLNCGHVWSTSNARCPVCNFMPATSATNGSGYPMFDGLKDAMNSGLSRFTIDGVTWRRDHQPIDGHIEALEDKVDGLDSELASALDVLYRRGDDEAREWIKLNYPKWTPGSLSVETQS